MACTKAAKGLTSLIVAVVGFVAWRLVVRFRRSYRS